MSNRSAEASIRGYYYQFLRTIESIYSLKNNSDTITIEGIEDIDISHYKEKNYVQCKYLSSKKYSYSSIREPIIEMLKHYSANPTNNKTYTLFAHFKDKNDNSMISFNLDELKKVLTYKVQDPVTKKYREKKYHEEHAISDTQLTQFAALLSVVLAKEFDSYQSDIISLVKKEFNCSQFTAENYYFNNSVKAVLDFAIKKSEHERTIAKVDFRYKVDCQQTLFNEWYKHHKGKDKYIAFVKKEIQRLNILSETKQRLIYIGSHFDPNSSEFTLVNLIENLVEKYYKIGRENRRTKPITIVADLSLDQLKNLKKGLIGSNIKYNDGHENIDFSIEQFREAPFIYYNKAGRMTDSSFQIKIISANNFENYYSSQPPEFHIIYISNKEFDRNINCKQLIEVKYLETLNEINQLLN